MSKLFVLFMFMNINKGCVSATPPKDEISIIKDALTAIDKNDSMALFKIMDTTHVFKLYSKEGFLSKIAFVNKRMQSFKWNIDSIKIMNEPPNHKKYSLHFSSVNQSSPIEGFDANFIFANYLNNQMIYYFDIAVPFKKPTEPNAPLFNN